MNNSLNLVDEWLSPKLAPEEHAWVERLVGRTLSTEEAQSFLHETWVRELLHETWVREARQNQAGSI